MGFGPTEPRLHRPLMGQHHLTLYLLVAAGEPHRHRLGSREGGVITPHRLLPVPATQVLSCCRILAGHHRQERLGVDLIAETETIRPLPPPAAWRLVTVEVVGGETLGVVSSVL